MVKALKFNIDGAEDADPGEGGNFYDGPVPPKGVYRCTLKFLRMKINKNGDHMFSGLLEIAEKGDKAKYNGYGIWFNGNLTKANAWSTNAFLDAFGFSRKAVWKGASGGIKIDEADGDGEKLLGTVTKIGTKAVAEDMPCRVATKRGKWDGEDRLELQGGGFLQPNADGEDDEEEWDEGEETEEVDAEVDDESDDEEEEDEDEEENLWTLENLPDDRPSLKEIAASYEIRVLKRHTEDDLKQLILEAQDAGEEEEDGEPPY